MSKIERHHANDMPMTSYWCDPDDVKELEEELELSASITKKFEKRMKKAEKLNESYKNLIARIYVQARMPIDSDTGDKKEIDQSLRILNLINEFNSKQKNKPNGL